MRKEQKPESFLDSWQWDAFDRGPRQYINIGIEQVSEPAFAALQSAMKEPWYNHSHFIEKILIAKTAGTSYIALSGLKNTIIYGPDFASYYYQYDNNSSKAITAIGYDYVTSLPIDWALTQLVGIGSTPIMVVSGLSDLLLERTRKQADLTQYHLRAQIANSQFMALDNMESGHYGASIYNSSQTVVLQRIIDDMERGRKGLAALSLPYKMFNYGRESFMTWAFPELDPITPSPLFFPMPPAEKPLMLCDPDKIFAPLKLGHNASTQNITTTTKQPHFASFPKDVDFFSNQSNRSLRKDPHFDQPFDFASTVSGIKIVRHQYTDPTPSNAWPMEDVVRHWSEPVPQNNASHFYARLPQVGYQRPISEGFNASASTDILSVINFIRAVVNLIREARSPKDQKVSSNKEPQPPVVYGFHNMPGPRIVMSREKCRDFDHSQGRIHDAFKTAKEICKNPGSVDDFYQLGVLAEKCQDPAEAKDAFITYIGLCEQLTSTELANEKTKLPHAALSVAESFGTNEPGKTLQFLEIYLEHKPSDTTVIKKCEDILIQSAEWEKLKTFYHKHLVNTDDLNQKLAQVDDFLFWDERLPKLDGGLSLIQLITNLMLRSEHSHDPDNPTRDWSKTSIELVRLTALMGQKLWIPHKRANTTAKVTGKKIGWRDIFKGQNIFNLLTVSAAVFRFLQTQPEFYNNATVQNINQLFLWMEGAALGYETAMFIKNLPGVIETLKDVPYGTVGSSCLSVFSDIRNSGSFTDGVQTGYGSFLGALENHQNAFNAVTDFAIQLGSTLCTVELVLKATGSPLIENKSWHWSKNALIYGGATLNAVGALTGAGAAGCVIGATKAAGAGAGYVYTTVAAGGGKAVLVVIGGGAAIVVGAAIAYAIYDWIDDTTTVQDQQNAIAHNAGLLASNGQFSQAIDKLKKIPNPSDTAQNKVLTPLAKAATQALENNDLPTTITHLDQMLSLKPDNQDIKEQRRFYSYQLDYNENKDQKLLETCQAALAADPKDATALRFAGMTHLKLHDLDQSTRYFLALSALNPNDSDACLFLSHIARLQQRYPQAQRFAEQAHSQAEQELKQNPEISRLQYQRDQAKSYQKAIQADVQAIWHSAAGNAAGQVVSQLVEDFAQVGMAVIEHRQNRKQYDNLILPFWDTLGKQVKHALPGNTQKQQPRVRLSLI